MTSSEALTADAVAMLADDPTSVSVVYNGVTTRGLVDHSADYLPTGDGGGMQQARVTTLTVVNGVLLNLRVDGRIIVDGAPYVIRDFDTKGIDDGVLSVIQLAKAT